MCLFKGLVTNLTFREPLPFMRCRWKCSCCPKGLLGRRKWHYTISFKAIYSSHSGDVLYVTRRRLKIRIKKNNIIRKSIKRSLKCVLPLDLFQSFLPFNLQSLLFCRNTNKKHLNRSDICNQIFNLRLFQEVRQGPHLLDHGSWSTTFFLKCPWQNESMASKQSHLSKFWGLQCKQNHH